MTDVARGSETVRIDASGPVAGGTAAQYELFFARRALAMLKSRLGRERLIDLLRPDTDQTEARFAEWVAESNGQYRLAAAHIRVSGLSIEEFLAYFESIRREEPKMLAAHPEHFVIGFTEGGFDVIENIGPFISHFNVHFTGEEEAIDELLPDHPFRMVGHSTMADGSVESHILHEFRDTGDGFEGRLALYFPSAMPEEIIEGHRQHLVVEFTNWIAAAAAALGRMVQ